MTSYSDDLYYLDYEHDNDIELQDTISIMANPFGYLSLDFLSEISLLNKVG